jgi:hypothetical protein
VSSLLRCGVVLLAYCSIICPLLSAQSSSHPPTSARAELDLRAFSAETTHFRLRNAWEFYWN